jgi:biopolymer transport protein TolR
MSMALGARGNASAEINVTPLIDVLLVLLIIFMVVLPQHHRGELADIPLPNKQHKPTAPEDPIVLQLLVPSDGQLPTLKINSVSVRWENLEGRLKEIFQLRSEKVAFLEGDPEIDFQYVADALDIARQAGVDRIGLMDAVSAKTKDMNLGEPNR